MDNQKGKLYLIPTTLGDNEPLEVLPLSVKKVIEELDTFIVENEKTARKFIKRITPRKSQPSLTILKYWIPASAGMTKNGVFRFFTKSSNLIFSDFDNLQRI